MSKRAGLVIFITVAHVIGFALYFAFRSNPKDDPSDTAKKTPAISKSTGKADTSNNDVDEEQEEWAKAPDVEMLASANWDNLPAVEPAATDWPWWRGAQLNNHAPADQKPPIEWSETKNILWRVKLPGSGHATPCMVGDLIFLPTADPDAKTISVLCLQRKDGQQVWKTDVYKGPFASIHTDNSYASATCVCDGPSIFFPYQTAGEVRLVALNLKGEIQWDQRVVKYVSVQGFSTSPALYRSAVIVTADGGKGSGPWRMAAFHRKTGEMIWRVKRYADESYGSPLVCTSGGREQVVIIGPHNTRSYDPATGRRLWEVVGPATYCAATCAFNDEMIFATAGHPQHALFGILADGTGDVTETHIAWRSDRKAGYVPSPLYANGLVYAISDKGLMRCYDAKNGKVIWEQNMKARFYSSPVLVGDKLYVFGRKGKGFVLAAEREYRLLATNTLPHGVNATPVILDSKIYLRSLGDFYCLGEK